MGFKKSLELLCLVALMFLLEVSCAPSKFDVSQDLELSDLDQQNLSDEIGDGSSDEQVGVDGFGNNAENLPPNQAFPLANGGLNSPGNLPQDIQGLGSLVAVPTSNGRFIISMAQSSFVYRNFLYTIQPQSSFVRNNRFTTVYYAPAVGQKIILEGFIGARLIECDVYHYGSQIQPINMSTTTIFYQW